ncbi:MAG: hypothetical protein U0T83_03500 [Bacteriovoracaceae bacterium]
MINLKNIFIQKWQKEQLAPFTIFRNEDGKGDFILDVLSEIVSLELNLPIDKLSTKIVENSIPDILYIRPHEGDKITQEETEKIFEFISLKNFKLKYKCIVVEKGELLNISSSNKLLKILEDPTPSTLFIFIVGKNQQLLKTVESRAISLTLPNRQKSLPLPETFESIIEDFTQKKISESTLIEELKKIPNADSLLLQKVLANCINEKENNLARLDKILQLSHNFEESTKYVNSVAERLYSLALYL